MGEFTLKFKDITTKDEKIFEDHVLSKSKLFEIP